MKITEAAIDIAEELAKYERGQSPARHPESIEHSVKRAFFRENWPKRCAGHTVPKRVVHTYGNIIDHDIVYNALQDLEHYRAFVQVVREYLESIGALDDCFRGAGRQHVDPE